MNIMDLPAFLDRLGVVEARMHLQSALSMEVNGHGEVFRMGRGQRLFEGTISVRPYPHVEASEIAAMLERLDEAGEAFLVYNMPLKGPRADPKGLALGAATPTVQSVDATDRRKVNIAGLPSGYALHGGDMLGYQVGTKYGLHRVFKGGAATSTGALAVELTSPTLSGAAGKAVQLVRPVCKAVLVPGSFGGALFRATVSDGMSFKWRQTLR